jgi:hypothetical protein
LDFNPDARSDFRRLEPAVEWRRPAAALGAAILSTAMAYPSPSHQTRAGEGIAADGGEMPPLLNGFAIERLRTTAGKVPFATVCVSFLHQL